MVEGDKCRYCDERAVVPVLDKSIERNPTGGGNKYRRLCLACERWSPMTSEEHYRNHARPHVLPVGADTEVVPLEEYDYGPEWADLAEQVGVTADTGASDSVALADGGPDHDPDDDPEPEPEPEPEPDVNRFDCPNCGVEQTGEPDECSDCGAVYSW